MVQNACIKKEADHSGQPLSYVSIRYFLILGAACPPYLIRIDIDIGDIG